ncbi:hypothetical protein HJFPF1_03891 [Paramyrothecium foliicola]|nr:hypothetical protein HJFPF1_03891 [Paramyrothecium foliicola]
MSLGFGSIWRARLQSIAIANRASVVRGRAPQHVRLSPASTSTAAGSRSYQTRLPFTVRHHPKTEERYSEVRRAAKSKLQDHERKVLAEIEAATEAQQQQQQQQQQQPSGNGHSHGLQAGPNHARNVFSRQAFRATGSSISAATVKMMRSPYVPTPRTYPSEEATAESLRHARSVARIQVGFDVLAFHRGYAMPGWARIRTRLKHMSAKPTDKPDMAAMRVLLPKSWELLALSPETVKYIESATGLPTRLRASPDHQQPRSVILRGKKSSLARAADELVAASPEIEVFQLGNVAAVSYEQKQLWPVIEASPDEGGSLPLDQSDSIWAHQELATNWIDTPYEKTPKPDIWTKETFQTYITKLVCGRLLPNLVMPLYADSQPYGSMGVDSDGIRVKLIMKAFEDPAARSCISLPVLKMALNFLSTRGGHRVSATRLFYLADKYGIPMDTDVFNILLHGYVIKRDAWHFYNVTRMMRTRFFRANAWTWLLLLRLVEKAAERRQIIAAIYEAGLFEDLAMRREIAAVMAPEDAYTAFKAGQSLDAFMKNQEQSYGVEWLTNESRHGLIQELLRFHQPQHDRTEDVKRVFAMRSKDGRPIKLETVNHILGWCGQTRNWPLAIWVLRQAKDMGIETDRRTYDKVIKLALAARSPYALSMAFFYAVVERKLQGSTRLLMRDVFLQRFKHDFWAGREILVGTKDMTRSLSRNRVEDYTEIVDVLEKAILKECDGQEEQPEKPLWYMLDFARRTMDGPLHSRIALGKEDVSKKWAVIMKLRGPSGKRNLRFAGYYKPAQVLKNWAVDGEHALSDTVAARAVDADAAALRAYLEAEAREEEEEAFDVDDYAEDDAILEQAMKDDASEDASRGVTRTQEGRKASHSRPNKSRSKTKGEGTKATTSSAGTEAVKDQGSGDS